ncbi:MAG: response regulator [Cellvibrionaceae bacterium]|nr:response regulator [Cellvibrionaceae bacterium]
MMSNPRHSILIFEDDLDLAKQWALALRSEGMRVAHAANMDEAKNYCQQQQFDLIICDMFIQDAEGQLAHQGGFSFIHYLRGTTLEHRPTWGAKVPILVVSGATLLQQFSFFEFARQWRNISAIKKPVAPEEMIKKVFELLQ